MKQVNVAVGVIVRQQQVFISKRKDDLHQGGKWEFPGGKIELNETPEDALVRELFEETGIQATNIQPLMVLSHDYGDKQVRLHVMVVDQFEQEPFGKEGQVSQWVAISSLDEYQFPEANQAIVTSLMAK